MEIELLITDFDGTLVNTFEANYQAYRQALGLHGIELSRERYRQCFGFRFDRFMDAMGIQDAELRKEIRNEKARLYPTYFNHLKVNTALIDFIRAFHLGGGKTAIASTARKENLMNALRYIGAVEDFDLIIAGEDVEKGKPDPEIYLKSIQHFNVSPEKALVFEDSEVGIKAAEDAGIGYIKITSSFF